MGVRASIARSHPAERCGVTPCRHTRRTVMKSRHKYLADGFGTVTEAGNTRGNGVVELVAEARARSNFVQESDWIKLWAIGRSSANSGSVRRHTKSRVHRYAKITAKES